MNELEPSWAKGYPGGSPGPTIAFIRAGVTSASSVEPLLRRGVPVPSILATTGPGRLWISLGANLLLDISSQMTESKHELKQ